MVFRKISTRVVSIVNSDKWHFIVVKCTDQKKRSAEAISEIPDTSADSGSGKSKGVNLFLARQKLIADMMAAEEEEARAAEGDNVVLCTDFAVPTTEHAVWCSVACQLDVM